MEKFNSFLHGLMVEDDDTRGKLLGAAIVVVNREGILYSGSAGRIDFPVESPKFTGDSVTWAASLTKLITSICAMQLVDRGEIGLDDDVRQLVPDLGEMPILRGFDKNGQPKLDANHSAITLRHLLTHTSGLSYDVFDQDVQKWSAAVGRTATMLDWSREGYTTPLRFPPSQGWCYGSSTDWAGLVVEKITGMTLGAYMRQCVFNPIGMRRSTFQPKSMADVGYHIAKTSEREGDSLRPTSPTPKTQTMDSGGVGLFTTANDFAKVLRDLLQQTPSLLSSGMASQMFSPQLDKQQAEMFQSTVFSPYLKASCAPEFPTTMELNHGLGGTMNMENLPGKRLKGSLTWSGMCNPRWWIDREAGVAAVMMVNVVPHGDPVALHIFDELERFVYSDLVGG